MNFHWNPHFPILVTNVRDRLSRLNLQPQFWISRPRYCQGAGFRATDEWQLQNAEAPSKG